MFHRRLDAIKCGCHALAVAGFGAFKIDRLGDGEVADDRACGKDQGRNFAQVDRPAILAEMQEGVAELDEVVEGFADLPV